MFIKRKKEKVTSIETLKVGDCLKRKREEFGYSLKEASSKLSIKIDHLKNLEEGFYEKLPPEVYVRGFLRSYSKLLQLDSVQILKMYSREMDFLKDNSSDEKKKQPKKEKIHISDFLVITPKLLTFLLSVFILSIICYYLYHQIDSFNSKPYLFIEKPYNGITINESEIEFSGYTEKGAVIRINGQEIEINSEGYFSQNVVLSEGRNVFVVETTNRFNKSEREEINVIYEKEKNEDIFIEEIFIEDEEGGGGVGFEDGSSKVLEEYYEEKENLDI